MGIGPKALSEFIRHRDLVRIERADVDSVTLQAFPLGFSDELLATQYVRDFQLDGLLFLHCDSITDIQVNKTAQFQRKLMESAGMLVDELFQLSHSLESFESLLAGLPANQIIILEKEGLEESAFWIGRYVRHEDGTHWMHEFTGAGNWFESLTKMDLDEITCCQLDTNYIRFYQDYFDKNGFPELPG